MPGKAIILNGSTTVNEKWATHLISTMYVILLAMIFPT
jgi:hypothetical protein